jgi:hypothetical protein
MGGNIPCWAGITIAVIGAIVAAAALLALIAYLMAAGPPAAIPGPPPAPAEPAAVAVPIHLHWGVHGHTNVCPTEEIREFAKELSKNRAKSIYDEINKYAEEHGKSGRDHKRTTMSTFGHADEELLIQDGQDPESARNMRVEMTMENPDVFHKVLDGIKQSNPGWEPANGFAMIGCAGVAVDGNELTHQKFEFEDHEAAVSNVEAVHELANVLRYLDLEANKVDVGKSGTPFKSMHEVHDHLHTHAHLATSLPTAPTVQFETLEAALDSAVVS